MTRRLLSRINETPTAFRCLLSRTPFMGISIFSLQPMVFYLSLSFSFKFLSNLAISFSCLHLLLVSSKHYSGDVFYLFFNIVFYCLLNDSTSSFLRFLSFHSYEILLLFSFWFLWIRNNFPFLCYLLLFVYKSLILSSTPL